ncbi:MAG: glycosyltransferase [Anaerolineae bacterium]|nr:glycosyltransferase [Anaerolineae bacterium]
MISVLMPTYGHAAMIARAIDSLCGQTYSDWELIIIDDASPDHTGDVVRRFTDDPRIHYQRLDHNVGMGAVLNLAFDQARGNYIAYLPSDDLYFRDHLAGLIAALMANPEAILAYSGVRYRYNKLADRQVDGHSIQLVQVLHRRTHHRWLTRLDLVSDDLDRLFWGQLAAEGPFVPTDQVTCEWGHHRDQLHRVIREPEGGINTYRSQFKVTHPLRFHSSVGNRIDEIAHYQRFRERPPMPIASDGLKIVLVGELAYNPERVLALAERGHQLYGLWMPQPHWYNTVGPLPFGHVTDLPNIDALHDLQPDLIYAQLNWQAVPFAHAVLKRKGAIPLIWHFKESPFICMDRGTWSQLIDLYTHSDGQILISPEMRAWFAEFIDLDPARVLVMDADLPKIDWFSDQRAPRHPLNDGAIHTVVPGRPIGLHSHVVEALAAQGIHVHFYGDYTHGQWKEWIDRVMTVAPGFLHLHSHVDQGDWVREFSQYDAGWLHFFQSTNQGELRRANWDDLNYPARIATLAMAGLPMLQRDNSGHLVATQSLVRELGIGLFFRDEADLGAQLRDPSLIDPIRERVWATRTQFAFDTHADRLIGFFRQVIQRGVR